MVPCMPPVFPVLNPQHDLLSLQSVSRTLVAQPDFCRLKFDELIQGLEYPVYLRFHNTSGPNSLSPSFYSPKRLDQRIRGIL